MATTYQELSEVYRRTTYYANTPRGKLAIHIDQCDAQLDLLLADHGFDTWAYLTAHNPRSKPLSAEHNRRRHERLESELGARGLTFFAGEGVGARGDWPPEISALVLGIDEAAARRLGEVFDQNAIVVGCLGKPAELVWLRRSSRIRDLNEGIDLNRRSNFVQAVAGLVLAIVGAVVGYGLATEERWLAAVAGTFVGLVIGVFLVGCVLMIWPRPRIDLDEARAKYERTHRRFKTLRWCTIAAFLFAFPVIGFLSRIDATWAFVIGALWPFLAVGLCSYAKGLKGEMESYKKALDAAQRD